eukprot:1137257-Pelagomonas_calceolata.AAC.2
MFFESKDMQALLPTQYPTLQELHQQQLSPHPHKRPCGTLRCAQFWLGGVHHTFYCVMHEKSNLAR